MNNINETGEGVVVEKPGVLTVEDKPAEDMVFALGREDIPAEDKKKKVPLPAIGTNFLIGNNAYTVVYINEGQNRFSCSPKK